jgi:hypothetical protein
MTTPAERHPDVPGAAQLVGGPGEAGAHREARAPGAAEAGCGAAATPDGDGRTRGALLSLFPVAPGGPAPIGRGRRVLAVAAGLAAVIAGAVLLLLRIPGTASWDTIYSEDYSEFLIAALQHPGDLFIQYNGYEELLPRVAAQLATYLPLADVAAAFAWCGALTASGCALFVFYASSGHIRSVTLRVLLAAAVILLSVAPMEIADSAVDAPWYLLLALFWAVLWRPRTPAGMAVAAFVGFLAAASTSIAFLFAPLLALRGFTLRRPRDHAVTAGWLAGCVVQLPLIVSSALSGQSRLVGGQNPGLRPSSPLRSSLSFFAHDVVLRSVGWHLSWWLESATTRNWATVIVAAGLAGALGLLVITQPRTRPFTIVAVAGGFVATVVCVFLTPWEATYPVTVKQEMASRYTALPIFLIEAALIAGADQAVRGYRDSRARPEATRRRADLLRPALAVSALVALLAVGWIPDFRYAGMRAAPSAHQWSAVVSEWHRDCQLSGTGQISAQVKNGAWTISCARLRFLPGAPPDAAVLAAARLAQAASHRQTSKAAEERPVSTLCRATQDRPRCGGRGRRAAAETARAAEAAGPSPAAIAGTGTGGTEFPADRTGSGRTPAAARCRAARCRAARTSGHTTAGFHHFAARTATREAAIARRRPAVTAPQAADRTSWPPP